jgi:hypothetical protein
MLVGSQILGRDNKRPKARLRFADLRQFAATVARAQRMRPSILISPAVAPQVSEGRSLHACI